MSLQTRYVTLDEYQEYFREDLRQLLGSQEDALAFMARVEDRLEMYINSRCNRNISMEYPAFTDYMKYCYKMALLEQAKYIIQNSDLSVESGLDLESGEVLSSFNINDRTLGPNAKGYLTSCGLLNRNANTHYSGMRIWRF